MKKNPSRKQSNEKTVVPVEELTLGELFPDSFMKAHTPFSSIEDFFHQAGFDLKTQADMEAISEKKLNTFLKKQTKFKSWEEMTEKASEEYVLKQFLS